jgi:hypothetical protein
MANVAGRHERCPQIVKVFGQELPVALQERDEKKKAGCVSLSRPTLTVGTKDIII